MVKKKTKSSTVAISKKWLLVGGIIIVVLTIGFVLFSFFDINPKSTGKFTEIVSGAPKLSLVSEKGSLLSAEKVILDGEDLGSASEGKITIEGISTGDHQIVIIINGVKYSKSFNFAGTDVSLSIPEPITAKIAVWSKTTNLPVSEVNVFLDEEGIKCITNNEGICSFQVSPDKHVIRLQGEGIYHEEIKTINKDSNSFTFKIERELTAQIKVFDELTNQPLVDAEIYFDGSYKGKTALDGSFIVKDVKEGSHSIRAVFKQVSKDVSQDITFNSNTVSISLKTPRTVTIELKDTETNKPIDGATIFLEGSTITYRSILPTDDIGKATVENVLPDNYQIKLESALGGFGAIKPAKLVTVGANTLISETVDMPNPRFQGSLSCSQYLLGSGECTVTIKNIDYERGITSQDTVVMLLIYSKESNGSLTLANRVLVDCGKILTGQSCIQKKTSLSGFSVFKSETIIALVFEGWKYTPQNENQIGTPTTLSPSFIENAIQEGINYCKQNLGQCIKTISGIIGTVV